MGRRPHDTSRRSSRREAGKGSWLVTLIDKISVLGTLVVMLVAVSLFAMLERALIAQVTEDEGRPAIDPAVHVTAGVARSPSSSARSSPTTPAAVLRDQAALRVLALRGARMRRTYRVAELPWPVVRLSRMNASRTWAFGSAVIPAPAGVKALPDSALFLAKAIGKGSSGWTVELAGTSGFGRLLNAAPASVIPAAERGLLRRYGSVPGGGTGAVAYDAKQAGAPRAVTGGSVVKPSPSAGGGTPKPRTVSGTSLSPRKSSTSKARETGLMLPWRAGQSWTLEPWVPGELSLRFDGGEDGQVVAAGDGRMYRLCSDEPDRGLIMVIHEDGVASQYYQLSGTPPRPDGSELRQGDLLGIVSTDRPCDAEQAQQARLRFALRHGDEVVPLDSSRIGGWTLHTTSAATFAERGLIRVPSGQPLLNFGGSRRPAGALSAKVPVAGTRVFG